MTKPSALRKKTTTSFLEISRQHFGLKGLLGSLLIAGSIGATQDNATTSRRVRESDTTMESTSSLSNPALGKAIEKMP